MAIAVIDLGKLNEDLPQEFLDILPTRCDYCEVPYLISETLTGLHCGNPRCISKVGVRIKAICQKLNILGFGEKAIDSFIDTYDITNPMDIFDLEEGMNVGESVGPARSETIVLNIKEVQKKTKFRLWEAVTIQQLPGIQTSAQQLLKDYVDIDEFYDDLHEGGVVWVQQRLGIATKVDNYGDIEVGIKAIKTFKTLLEYEDDVKEGVGYLQIETDASIEELTVVVSDQAGGGFKTKNEFYAYCKEHFSDRYHFNFAGSVSKKSTQVLIWAGADGTGARFTSKVEKVERYNSQDARIPILTAGQFVDFLESERDFSEIYDFSLEQNDSAVAVLENGPELDMMDVGLL